MFGKLTVAFDKGVKDHPVSATNRVSSEKLPPLLAAAAERGLKFGLQSGEVGYPVLHVHATILDAQVDQQISTEQAFEAAGTDAVMKALRRHILPLEPTICPDVQLPDEHYRPIPAAFRADRT